jgi:hypothetical protein
LVAVCARPAENVVRDRVSMVYNQDVLMATKGWLDWKQALGL